jgi:hypothetical protein
MMKKNKTRMKLAAKKRTPRKGIRRAPKKLAGNAKKVATRSRRKRPKGGDSDRGLYVRFENPAVKAKVKAAAKKRDVSMNAYIVDATLAVMNAAAPQSAPAAA